MYRLLVLDIDGTLTNNKKEITPNTKAAIKKAQEKGVKIVIATGRPTKGAKKVAKELNLFETGGYILSFNGGRITDCKTGEVIFQRVLEKEDVAKIYEIAKENKIVMITYEGDTVLMEVENDEYANLEARLNEMETKLVDSIVDYVDFPVNKCLMTGDGDYLAGVEQKALAKYRDDYSIFRSEAFFLEFMPKGVDKAKSLERLLEYLGCEREEMIACGDGFNDASMIQYAGLGVAMENAKEQVKEVADFITKSNEEDGVAYVIERFILEKEI